MGTGKSTIGEYLSLEKQLSFIDLDVYIEIKENKTMKSLKKLEKSVLGR